MNILENGRHEVLVVGAGVVGAAISFELCRRGLRVCCIHNPEHDETSASFAAGAMLGAFGEVTDDKSSAADRAETDLRVACARRYPDFVAALNASASPGVEIRQGTFIIANPAGKDDVCNILRIQKEAARYEEPNEWVEPGDIPGYRPHKSLRASKALFLPRENYLNSHTLLRSLRSAATASGRVSWLHGTVAKVSVAAEGRVTGVELRDGRKIGGDRVVLASGYGTRHIVEQSGPDTLDLPKLKGGKGSSLVLRSRIHLPHVIRTPNRDFACGTHVVARGPNEIYVGATNRISDTPGENTGVTPGELHVQIHSCLHEINTSLRTDEVISMRAGTRPLTSDGYPLIGRTRVDGLFIATGTYRNGILLAPGIADIIASEVSGTLPVGSNPFDPRRRQLLKGPAHLDEIVRSGVRDLVSFIQEPHGSLPYERARELESFMSVLLMGALTENEASAKLLASARRALAQDGQTETIAALYYDLASTDVPAR